MCLENEPKKIEVDNQPELTASIIKVYQSTMGEQINLSPLQIEKFMMASSRLNKYFKDNISRLNGRHYNNKMKATTLLESVFFDVGDQAITPGWLCSNETFNRRLPDYCEEHIWVRKRR